MVGTLTTLRCSKIKPGVQSRPAFETQRLEFCGNIDVFTNSYCSISSNNLEALFIILKEFLFQILTDFHLSPADLAVPSGMITKELIAP